MVGKKCDEIITYLKHVNFYFPFTGKTIKTELSLETINDDILDPKI